MANMVFDYLPPKQGLYDPSLEKDSCGVGAVIDREGTFTHKTGNLRVILISPECIVLIILIAFFSE
jgi:hypothetical protein